MGVRVRMYRPGGLGDCFLLSFPGENGAIRVLIDCGVLLGTSDKRKKLTAVAKDIEVTTGGRIDLLIATHQHYDHLSGFEFAHTVFSGMEIGAVWLAWTEDPDDPLAGELRRQHDQGFAALRGVHARLEAAGTEQSANALLGAAAREFGTLLDFSAGREATAAAIDRPRGTRQQLAFVQSRVAEPRYLQPGAILPVPGTEVTAFVLGPPRDLDLLTRSNPSKRDSEVYGASLTPTEAFFADTGLLGEGDSDFPFERNQGLDIGRARRRAAFRDYFRKENEWRSIDHAWLGAAYDLALKLDEDTNNTSLALAFELPDRRVLLFPADAQVGNWLSWHRLTFPGGVGAEDLLERTVLYKVGHHGSHNATLEERGLELMTSPELVAMIPVDEEQAGKQGRSGWKMPFKPLYERLAEKTSQRILRSDARVPKKRPRGVEATVWSSFHDRLTQTDLYLEYELGEDS